MSVPPHLRLPEGARARRLDTARGIFAVHEAGPAPGQARGLAVLVPGFTGSKEDYLLVLGPLAQAGYRLVALDQRGQYETPGPDDPAAYALDELGRDVLAVAAAAGPGPAHLVGHSFGGLVVRAAALTDPAAARSVTLLCSGPAAIPAEAAGRARKLIRALRRNSLAEIWAYDHERARAAGELDGVPPEVVAFLRARFVANSPAALAAMAGHLADTPDRTDDLAALGLPTLVAYGAADDVWPLAEQAAMAVRLGARHEVIAGGGHSPAVQAPAATAEVLASFWASVPAG